MPLRWSQSLFGRLVLVYLGCVFLATDLLHLQELGGALPFTGIVAIASVLLATRDIATASADLQVRHPAVQIALGLVGTCTLVGGIASAVPAIRFVDDGQPSPAHAISQLAAPIVWAALFVLTARAASKPSPRRLAQLGLASAVAWPCLHLALVFAQFTIFSEVEIVAPHVVCAYAVGVYGVLLVGVTLGFVGPRLAVDDGQLPMATATLVPCVRTGGSCSSHRSHVGASASTSATSRPRPTSHGASCSATITRACAPKPR